MADYPYDRYPPFIAGGCVLMTRYNARLFYIASKYIPFFRFDDVYMGQLAYSMSIRLVQNNKRFPPRSKLNLNSSHVINKNETESRKYS